MNIFRKTILTALILCSSYVPILSDIPAVDSNQSFNHSADLQLVPFDFIQHGPQAQQIFRQSFGLVPSILRGEPDITKAYVLAYQGTVIGVILYLDYPTQRYICNVCVDSAYRNKNYGTYFMHEFEQLSYNQGITEISLSPVDRAVPFYTRLGFQFMPRTRAYMVKKLMQVNQNTPQLA